MTSRLLPPEEWPRLEGTEAETIWPHMNPADARVLVVEDDGEIVGTWVIYRQVHVEGVWIDEDYRGSPGVIGRLLQGMRRVAQDFGARAVVTGAVSDDVERLIKKLGGARLPGTAFAIPIQET